MERIIKLPRSVNKIAKREIKNNYIKSKEIILNKQIFGNQKVFVNF